MASLALSFDIGGTFTDFVVIDLDSGSLVARQKVLTNARAPEEGVLDGWRALLEAGSVSPPDTGLLVHSTTLVTNAVIERKGARTVLLATKGFRDVLELGRQQMYDIYDLFAPVPEPLIPRPLRLEVDERIDATGAVVRPLCSEAIAAAVEAVRAAGAEAVAIAFLHSYLNPEHERAMAAALQAALPEVDVTLSSAVAPIAGEYERTSTAAADAFTKPAVRRYLDSLSAALERSGADAPLHLMLSSGEIASSATAIENPIRLLESGPAAGALAAAFFGRLGGHADMLSLDMGGTTAKACVIEGGRPEMAQLLEVARTRRFMKGSGLPIVAPVVDLIEIGAGGGSIARRDELGLLKVGPDSAGADPGPACYGLGGELPTVSDANLILGYLNPDYFLGGEIPLRADLAREAVAALASELDLSIEDTAWGIHRVVNENMAAAARVHIIERNRDPRSLATIAFGGAGPAHAAAVARILGSPTVIFPPAAGVASALGALVAPLAFTAGRTRMLRLDQADWQAVAELYAGLEAEAIRELGLAGVTREQITFTRWAEMRILGQYHEIAVPLDGLNLGEEGLPEIEAAFQAAYRRRYGRVLEGLPIEALHWRLTASGPPSPVDLRPEAESAERSAEAALKGSRPACFPFQAGAGHPEAGFRETPVYDRELLLPGMAFNGPAIVEEREATAVIWPGDRARVDRYRAIVVDVGAAPLRDMVIIANGRQRPIEERGTVGMTSTIAPAGVTGQAQDFDPVSLEIMWSRLISVADEMWTTVLRTAVSTIIGAAQDFGCELLDARGESLAHSYRSMPVFNLVMPVTTRKLIEVFPVEAMRPGDIFTTNDPWLCAGHLDDIAVLTPIFRGGRVVAFANTIAHTSSIGGALDGMAVRDLHEEGLFIPPLKLYDEGRPNETLFAMIASNVRQPEMVLTDIEAQVTANELAASRILAFMDEYGLESLSALSQAVQSRAEAAMRAAIEAIPDGRYEAEEWMEGVEGPIPLRAAIEVRGGDIFVDYSGSAPQTIAGGISCAFIYTQAHTVYPLKSILTPRIPSNEGCFRPIHVSAPERSILNALPPASVNSRTKTGWHLHTLLFRALSAVIPERVQAGNGLMYVARAYARDAQGAPSHASIICGGGRGAGHGEDGMTRNCYPSSAGTVAAEIIESRVPVLIEEDSLVPDSGGRGRWRGSPGQRLTVRKRPGHELPVSIFIHPDRLRFPAPGLAGGESSHTNLILFNGQNLAPDGALTTGEVVLSGPEDRFTTVVAGGGGYGSPAERDPAALARDIEYGYVTREDR